MQTGLTPWNRGQSTEGRWTDHMIGAIKSVHALGSLRSGASFLEQCAELDNHADYSVIGHLCHWT